MSTSSLSGFSIGPSSHRPAATPLPQPSLLDTAISAASTPYLTSFADSELPFHSVNLGRTETSPASQLRVPIFGAKRPLLLASAAGSGKFVMAMGASAAVKAAYTSGTLDTVVSSLMLMGGFGAALMAAIFFGQDVHAQAPQKVAWALKGVSVSAALTLAGSSGLHQYLVDKNKPILHWVSFALAALGYGLLCISLPAFFMYCEQRHGRAIVRGRQNIQRTLGGAGFAFGFAWAANIGTAQSVPPYVGPVALTVAATSVVLAFAMGASDARRAALAQPIIPL